MKNKNLMACAVFGLVATTTAFAGWTDESDGNSAATAERKKAMLAIPESTLSSPWSFRVEGIYSVAIGGKSNTAADINTIGVGFTGSYWLDREQELIASLGIGFGDDDGPQNEKIKISETNLMFGYRHWSDIGENARWYVGGKLGLSEIAQKNGGADMHTAMAVEGGLSYSINSNASLTIGAELFSHFSRWTVSEKNNSCVYGRLKIGFEYRF